MIKNPILCGFNPDPSIVRVEDDYYIATSTFEWFPGVQIHHSKDLNHWRLLTRPLCKPSQLNMLGDPNSGGVYAPCLSYDDGVFYLLYSDVKVQSGRFWDCHNFLTTTTDICGEWSDPVYLNSSGIDPSLFHAPDGRKWLLNVRMGHRDGTRADAPDWDGILLQEYDPQCKELTGEARVIFQGSCLGVTEGPHLYYRNGRYHLITAEGGTFYGHAVTSARSDSIEGPYEIDPMNPILTARYDCTLPLQRTGHADLVETRGGEWYMVHLCGRPMPSYGRCVMGRETAIQKMEWTEDGWIRLASGDNLPEIEVEGPDIPIHCCPEEDEFEDFETAELPIQFQTLRVALDNTQLSLTERTGYLRLKGYESPSSLHHQSLVARRQQAFSFTAETCVEFSPDSYQQMAGLIYYYDTVNYCYLHVTQDEKLGRCVNVLVNDLGNYSLPLGHGAAIAPEGAVYLKAVVTYHILRFYYSQDGTEWMQAGPDLDASKLSDEYFISKGIKRFTGAFIGMCCQDFTGKKRAADFDFFSYKENSD